MLRLQSNDHDLACDTATKKSGYKFLQNIGAYLPKYSGTPQMTLI